jgi:flagellar protein FlaG
LEIRPLELSSPLSTFVDGGVAAGAAAQKAQSAAPLPTRAEVEVAVQHANASLAAMDHALEFTIDPDTKSVIVRLIDRQDNSVLRQVPSPEMLAIAKALGRMQGLLLQSTA